MIINFKTGKEYTELKHIHSRDIISFKKELKEYISHGYVLKVLNTSLKYTSFGKRQSYFAVLAYNCKYKK